VRCKSAKGFGLLWHLSTLKFHKALRCKQSLFYLSASNRFINDAFFDE